MERKRSGEDRKGGREGWSFPRRKSSEERKRMEVRGVLRGGREGKRDRGVARRGREGKSVRGVVRRRREGKRVRREEEVGLIELLARKGREGVVRTKKEKGWRGFGKGGMARKEGVVKRGGGVVRRGREGVKEKGREGFEEKG